MKLLIVTLMIVIGLSFITTRKATYDIVGNFSSIEMDYEKAQRKNPFIFILRALIFGVIILILLKTETSRLYFNFAIAYTVICMHLSNLKFICTKVPEKLILFDMFFRLTIFIVALI